MKTPLLTALLVVAALPLVTAADFNNNGDITATQNHDVKATRDVIANQDVRANATVNAGTTMYAGGAITSATGFTATGAAGYVIAGGPGYIGNFLRVGGAANAPAAKSVQIGQYATTDSFNSLVVGRYNLNKAKDGATAPNATAWIANDPLFVVGNGDGAGSPNNAFTVYKDGTVAAVKSVQIGQYTTTDSFNSLVVGRHNINKAKDGTTAPNATTWIANDPLLVVGNGDSVSNPNNALTVYKDGTITMSKVQGDISMGQFGN